SYTYRVTPLSALGDGPSTTATGTTRLPAVSGLAFTSKASNQFVIQWNDISGETAYRIERSTDGSTFSTLATVNPGVTTYTDNTVQPLVEYYYHVIGMNDTLLGMTGATIFAA